MALAPILPRPQAAVVTASGLATADWYEFFRLLRSFAGENIEVQAQITALEERVTALEDGDELARLVGPASVRVTGSLADALVQFFLDGDQAAPGNTYFYGTGPDGAKGFFTVASAVLGEDSVVQDVDADTGIVTFHLDGDVAAPGMGYTYATHLTTGVKGWYRPALFESTGLLDGGTLSINADPTKFDVAAAVVGYTDYTVNAAAPTRSVATFGPSLANAVPSLAVIATYVGIATPGLTLVQQSTPFTPTQRRTIVPLGAVIANAAGTALIAVNNLPDVMRAGINQIQDLMEAVGPINRSGNVIGPNGANLQINKSAGTLFKQGSNFASNEEDPHNLALASLTAPATLQYRTSTGTATANTSSVNVTQYESAPGVLSTVPNNRFTIQRIALFTSNLIRIQYGQHVYQTMAEAEASLVTESFTTEQNIADNGVLRCFLIVGKNATDLSDAAQAKFIPASKFGGPLGSGGTSITTTDSLPEGVTNLYYTNERVDDRVAALIVDSASVTWAYNDAAGTLTATATGTPGGGTKAQFLRGDNTWAMDLVTTSNPGFQGIKYSNDAAGFQFRFIKYRGTEAVPAAAQANDVLMPFQARGGISTAGVISESGNLGAYVIKAAENLTNTGQGTFGVLQSVPVGSTTLADQYLWNDVAFTPATTGVPTLGSSSLRWGTVYGVSLNVTTAVAATMGGTGQSSYAVGDLLYASTTTALSKLPAGTNGHVLTLAGGLPSWAASAGLTHFTEGLSTAAPNTIVPVASLTATNAATDVDAAFIPKGAGAILAAVPNNAASGGNKRGDRAVDFQRSRTTAAQVASGQDSGIACGIDNTASGTNAFIGGGNGNTTSGASSATLGGTSGTASGLRSAIVGGSSNTASGAASVAHGTQANTKSIENARAIGGVTGKQALEVPLFTQTTNATPTTLRSNSGSAAATNQFALSSGSAAMVRVRVVARQSAGTGAGACAGWDTNVLIKNIGGTTSLVGTPSVAQAFGDAGASAWTIAITADDTNDALKIEVTGEASKTIQWTAHVVGVEA